ncbi:MAG TPA: hypothetical protein DEQ02_01870, partial [Ruminococcaceae bacterium]|nr:hypothetical protein [Oscillospiraceae bacterium]
MPKIREVLGNIFPFMRTRIFAAALLAVFCAVSISAAAFGTTTVRINDDGRQRSILTVDEDLGLVLEHAGVTVSKDDIVTFSGFEDGFAEIDIIRAFEVKVKQQSGVKTLTMAEGTVKDALRMAGIKADAYDNVNYGVFENVVPGMEISYEDVDYEFETKQEPIDFETVTEYSAEIESGKEELVDGSEGIRETTLRHKTVDGAVVETAKISSEVIKQPVSAKKLIGTKVPQRRAGPAGKITVPTGSVPAAVTNSSAVNTISPLMPDTPIDLDENGRPVNYSMLITGK